MQIDNTFDIAADPAEVWPVIRDVARWHEWTPSITRIEVLDDGPFRVGTRARVKQPGFPAVVWTVTELEEGTSFTWESRSPGLVSTGIHRVVPGPQGSVATLGIRQEGALEIVARVLFGKKSRRFVQMEADGLRARTERASRSASV